MKNKIIMVAIAASLWGCDQNDQGAASVAPEATVPAEVVVPAVKAVTKAEESQEKKKKKLNLSIPESDLNGAVANDAGEEAKVLPDMFVKREQGTKVSGDVLRDQENEDYLDSVQGAQVKIEMKTD